MEHIILYGIALPCKINFQSTEKNDVEDRRIQNTFSSKLPAYLRISNY